MVAQTNEAIKPHYRFQVYEKKIIGWIHPPYGRFGASGSFAVLGASLVLIGIGKRFASRFRPVADEQSQETSELKTALGPKGP